LLKHKNSNEDVTKIVQNNYGLNYFCLKWTRLMIYNKLHSIKLYKYDIKLKHYKHFLWTELQTLLIQSFIDKTANLIYNYPILPYTHKRSIEL